ncbi:hypothetical protein [Thermomonospora catenispora]|uniref:hypothetical protein n=1 Tax=Thermomonospora catenispora TaxID=2493090 RepID=UPI00112056A3|nr:hypothetical protein [Thermomonospora catenispora]TNY36450.1 hypothetical protein EIO00_12955 [Thermomonospora catenispora]
MSAIAAAFGGLGASALDGPAPLVVALAAGATGTVISFAVGLVWALQDIRTQQRIILARLEDQTRLMHHAARLAAELGDDAR